MKAMFKMVSALLVTMLVLVAFPTTSAHAACTTRRNLSHQEKLTGMVPKSIRVLHSVKLGWLGTLVAVHGQQPIRWSILIQAAIHLVQLHPYH